MRALLTGLIALAPLSAFAQRPWVESAVTVALTLDATGPTRTAPGTGGATSRITDLLTKRIGNKEILDRLQAEGFIEEVRGWSLVAVWDDWADSNPKPGVGYRFYAKRSVKGLVETVQIPATFLSLESIDATFGEQITLKNDAIKSGTETYRDYSRLKFALATGQGTALGLRNGKGRYAVAKGATEARYLPDANSFLGAGLYENPANSTDVGTVGGGITFAAGRLVPESDYTRLTTSGYPADTGLLILTGAVGGTLTIESAAITTGTWTPGGTTDTSTLNNTSSAAITGSTFTFDQNPGNLTLSAISLPTARGELPSTTSASSLSMASLVALDSKNSSALKMLESRLAMRDAEALRAAILSRMEQTNAPEASLEPTLSPPAATP